MTYEESIAYIHSINWTFCNPGLDRTRALCEKIGNPQEHLKFIHVAGTNGKGSFCAMTDSILRAAGYRVGLYTSPYVKRFNERMMIDGQPIADEELAELTTEIRPIADAMTDRPTEFELITAIAFAYFYRHKCDIVVLEVGLGGRLDSTNVIPTSVLSVITGIDFDHTRLLGNTIQKIAAEKAGIVKSGCPCLYGGYHIAACRTIRAVAAARSAPFYTVDRTEFSVKKTTLDGTTFDFHEMKDIRLSLLGSYQPYNAAIVLTAFLILKDRGFPVTEEQIRKGLSTVRWPARFELLSTDPIVLYDGGHNPQGVAAAVESIRTYFDDRKVLILSGVMADKNYDEMVETLKPVTEEAFTVAPNNPRALSAEEYAKHFTMHKVPVKAFATVEEGIRAAVARAKADNLPLICLGSLYLYAEATEILARVLGE